LLLLDNPLRDGARGRVARHAAHQQVSVDRTVLIGRDNMSVVSSIADTSSVLQRGRVIAAGLLSEVSKNPQVVEAYMGTSSTASRAPADGARVLKKLPISRHGTESRTSCTVWS